MSILENSISIFAERSIDKPQINISVNTKDNQVILSIEDNAGGIEKRNIYHIFLRIQKVLEKNHLVD